MDDFHILTWIIAAAVPAIVEIFFNRGE